MTQEKQMKKPGLYTALSLLTLFFILVLPAARARPLRQAVTCSGGRLADTCIPVVDLNAAVITNTYLSLPAMANAGSNPANPYAVIRKDGPYYAAPEAVVTYEITLANYEMQTHQYELVEAVPDSLDIVPASLHDLTYDSATRQLHWSGPLPPAHLGYILEESTNDLPYLDLASFGIPNLCDDLGGCDEAAVTFNLGVNGYTFNFYGELLTELVVSANGLILGHDQANAANQWLPDAAVPGPLLAGLWRDMDMSHQGRWHAAIVMGLLDAPVFYVQWHDAPHATDPDATVRLAMALVLDGSTANAMSGQAFFIYDNIANPEQTIAGGYTIGVEDALGERGLTYAFAPCCGQTTLPIGYLPGPNTVLHLRPILFQPDNEYARTFSYQAVIRGHVPETIITTARASSDSPNPAVNDVWSTHYLYVRWQHFLPVLFGDQP
jgi:hypothetical protein